MSERYHATAALVRAEHSLRENAAQWSVYTSDGDQVVLAGPGSGKTHVLAAKVARLLADDIAPPQGVACLTYNNECVREFRARLRRLGVADIHNVVVTTVHRFCLRQVLLPFARLAESTFPENPVVASEAQQADLLNACVESVLGRNRAAWSVPPWELGGRVHRHRVRSLERAGPGWEAEGRAVRAVITRYEKALREKGLMDFEMMVLDATTLIRTHGWVREMLRSKFPVLVVDEYQDLGVALNEMLVTLATTAGVRLIAVGDPDQSIYGFTGTEPRLLRALGERLEVVPTRLRFNYRSGRTIVRASTLVLGEARDYEARVPHAGEIFFHERADGLDEQAAFVCGELVSEIRARHERTALGDIAVLYPTAREGTAVALAAERFGLPVQRVDTGAPYRKTPFTRWLEDCAAWCATRPGVVDGVLTDPQAVPSFRALVMGWGTTVLLNRQLPPSLLEAHRLALADTLFAAKDASQPLVDWLAHLGDGFVERFLPNESTYDDVRGQFTALLRESEEGALANATVRSFGRQVGDPNVLNLVTLHSAKGLEFDSVILVGLEEGVLPRWGVRSDDDLVEARRVFYVGLTRARREVHVTYSGFTQNAYGRRFVNGPSRFVLELQERLKSGT